MMGNLQGLPVLIWDEAGLNQDAVDQSESHRKGDDSGSQLTCEETSLHIRNITDLFPSSQHTAVWSSLF